MRQRDQVQGAMFVYGSIKERVPANRPLRRIRPVADAVLKEMSPCAPPPRCPMLPVTHPWPDRWLRLLRFPSGRRSAARSLAMQLRSRAGRTNFHSYRRASFSIGIGWPQAGRSTAPRHRTAWIRHGVPQADPRCSRG